MLDQVTVNPQYKDRLFRKLFIFSPGEAGRGACFGRDLHHAEHQSGAQQGITGTLSLIVAVLQIYFHCQGVRPQEALIDGIHWECYRFLYPEWHTDRVFKTAPGGGVAYDIGRV